jgi:hypothetical protein
MTLSAKEAVVLKASLKQAVSLVSYYLVQALNHLIDLFGYYHSNFFPLQHTVRQHPFKQQQGAVHTPLLLLQLF